MNRFVTYFALLALATWLLLLASCAEDKLYSGPDRPLAFSTDTLRFDTVFTAKGTASRSFKIYNPYRNPMIIQRITHGNPVFRLNIDGRSCDSVSNLRIEAHDSLRVLVQAYIDPTDDTRPLREEDVVAFYCNGQRQQVALQVFGRNVMRVQGWRLVRDTVFDASRPILVQDSLVVAEGVHLRLDPGVVMYFEKKASMVVYGTLQCAGTREAPVLMRGDRSDYMNTVPPLNYDQASAQWQGIWFKPGSVGNLLDGLVMRNSTWGVRVEADNTDQLALCLRNSKLSNASGNLMTVSGARVQFENSLFYNAGGYVLNLSGGDCQACYCTFANYYGFSWGGRNCAIVRHANFDWDAAGNPVGKPLNLQVANSIVYGSWKMELSKDSLGTAPLNYQYTNCLLKVKASAIDGHYASCVYEDPKFVFLDWDEDAPAFEYDFHIGSASAAIGKAKHAMAASYPFDLDGNSRTSDGSSDIGCYEFTR
ncbi:MAG: hypothetical protein J6Y77_00400 [Paludibacteraceae bacterium]|nr:hypothetical protein [Paludibacteraceae bacterium]